MSTARPASQTNWLLIILCILGGLAFLCLLGVGLVCAGMYSAWANIAGAAQGFAKSQITVQQFFAHVKSGNTAQAYLLTTQGFQRTNSLEQFQDFFKQRPRLQNHQDAQIQLGPHGGRPGAILGMVTVTAADGKVIEITLDLVREGNDWKIENLSIK